MYIQITDRCNMKCAHCCFDCTDKGNDMTEEIFNKALEIANNFGDTIAIGGGEPTLHPLFLNFLGKVIMESDCDECVPFVATNGSMEKESLIIARLARKGVICGALSTDKYHDASMVSNAVKIAFESNHRSDNDLREKRNVEKSVKKIGRAKQIKDAKNGCACPDLFVDPLGNIYACGCKTILLGTVFNFTDIPDGFDLGECGNNQNIAV